MNGYKAFYRGKTCEVLAETSLKAQALAAEKFSRKALVKSYEVTVVLCEKDGEQVTHSTSEV